VAGPNRRALLMTLVRAQARLGDVDAALATALELETDLISSGRSGEQITSDLHAVSELVPSLVVGAGRLRTPELRPRRID